MHANVDLIVVAGFLLAVLGLVLRTIIMMRAGDTRPANAVPLIGGDLVRAYRVANPASWFPRIAQVLLGAGLILLIAGFLLAFR